jgi:hypothetical protein
VAPFAAQGLGPLITIEVLCETQERHEHNVELIEATEEAAKAYGVRVQSIVLMST